MDLFNLQDKKIDNNQESILEEAKINTNIEENKENKENKNNHTIKSSVWDEFKEFYNELWDLLKIDLYNSYLFITENKNYLVCAIILAILLQFADINNLGTSFEKFCNKNNIQSGGDGEMRFDNYKYDPKPQTQTPQTPQTPPTTPSNSDKDKLASDKAKKIINKKDELLKGKHDKDKSKKAYKSQKIADKEAKINQKRISFFENIKNKFGKGGTWGGQYGVLGPVFGNMEKIIDSVKTVFYIVTVILTIAGIISIPVLIFLIITYMVFKTMVNNFLIL